MDIKIVNGDNITITYDIWGEIKFKHPKMPTLLDEVLKSIVNDNKIDREVCVYQDDNSRTFLTFKYDGNVDHRYINCGYSIESYGFCIHNVDMELYTAEFVCMICDILGYDRGDYV